METANAISPAMADMPPWEMDLDEPETALPPTSFRAVASRGPAPRITATPIPWSIVALAAFTAAIVTLNAQPKDGGSVRELPSMAMIAAGR